MFQACVCPFLVQFHKYPSDGANGDPWSANVVLEAPVLTDSTPWHVVTRWSSGQEFQVSSRRNDRLAVRVPGVIQEAALAAFRPQGAPYPSLIFHHLAHRPDMLSPSFTMPYLFAYRCHHMYLRIYTGRHRVISCPHMFLVLF